MRPRVVIAVPSGITEVEKRAVKESAAHAGARVITEVQHHECATERPGLATLKNRLLRYLQPTQSRWVDQSVLSQAQKISS